MNVDVVVPLFNKGNSIIRCLASIESQTVTPNHVVVINDGSTDDSLQKVEQFAKESRLNIVLKSQPNAGVAAARNSGFKHCSADLVCLLDGDDEWQKGHVERMIALANDFPEAVLYCGSHLVSEAGQVYRPPHGLPEDFRGYVPNFFTASSRGSVANSSKVAIRPTALSNVGGFPDQATVAEDLFVWVRLAMIGKVACDMSTSSAIVHREPDLHRSSRSNYIPYPLIFFGERPDLLSAHKGLRRYLVRIGFFHVAGAMLEGNRVGAHRRARALFRISTWAGAISMVLSFLPSKIFVLAKRRRLLKKNDDC